MKSCAAVVNWRSMHDLRAGRRRVANWLLTGRMTAPPGLVILSLAAEPVPRVGFACVCRARGLLP
jgi:hypothetical protein